MQHPISAKYFVTKLKKLPATNVLVTKEQRPCFTHAPSDNRRHPYPARSRAAAGVRRFAPPLGMTLRGGRSRALAACPAAGARSPHPGRAHRPAEGLARNVIPSGSRQAGTEESPPLLPSNGRGMRTPRTRAPAQLQQRSRPASSSESPAKMSRTKHLHRACPTTAWRGGCANQASRHPSGHETADRGRLRAGGTTREPPRTPGTRADRGQAAC